MNNLLKARKIKGLTQAEVARRMDIDRSTYTRYESGEIQPDNDKLRQLALIFETSIDYLLGYAQTDDPMDRLIPLLGTVPAGVPIEAIEDIEEYIDIYPRFVKHGDLFALRVGGDSMEPEIKSGDIVIVEKQDFAINGDIVVIRVNGEEVTVKRIKISNDGIMLIPTNNAYFPTFFDTKSIKTLPVTIVGKVIEIRRRL